MQVYSVLQEPQACAALRTMLDSMAGLCSSSAAPGKSAAAFASCKCKQGRRAAQGWALATYKVLKHNAVLMRELGAAASLTPALLASHLQIHTENFLECIQQRIPHLKQQLAASLHPFRHVTQEGVRDH